MYNVYVALVKTCYLASLVGFPSLPPCIPPITNSPSVQSSFSSSIIDSMNLRHKALSALTIWCIFWLVYLVFLIHYVLLEVKQLCFQSWLEACNKTEVQSPSESPSQGITWSHQPLKFQNYMTYLKIFSSFHCF